MDSHSSYRDPIGPAERQAKVLVVIANHGTKNQRFLDRVLAEYRSMERHRVHIVVLSDIPKGLGPDIEVKVGAPTKDPWSLPFGYKDVFMRGLEDYDLFVYSEDDTLITESHIEAFEDATRVLPENLIAGFMRYEVDADGKRFYSSMHSHHHWRIDSVRSYGNSLFAYYTNEHSACFILTRCQLRRAIASGGFTLPAREGRYDMLVTAATDPYTECGMTKVICISRIDDFCLHHLPNAYCGKLGLDAELGNIEMRTLGTLEKTAGKLPVGPLFKPYPLRDGDRWNKKYYESPREDILKMVPPGTRSVLSVGCGSGTTEETLIAGGIEVAGIPLDAVIASVAASKGISMLPPDLALAIRVLSGRRFDCIVIADILQQFTDPVHVLTQLRSLLDSHGVIIVSVPNWNYYGTVRSRLSPSGRRALEYREPGGVYKTTRNRVSGWLRKSGVPRIEYASMVGTRWAGLSRLSRGLVDGLVSRNLVVTAQAEAPIRLEPAA